jgi:hypothetical protein
MFLINDGGHIGPAQSERGFCHAHGYQVGPAMSLYLCDMVLHINLGACPLKNVSPMVQGCPWYPPAHCMRFNEESRNTGKKSTPSCLPFWSRSPQCNISPSKMAYLFCCGPLSAITQSAPPDNHLLALKVHHLRM